MSSKFSIDLAIIKQISMWSIFQKLQHLPIMTITSFRTYQLGYVRANNFLNEIGYEKSEIKYVLYIVSKKVHWSIISIFVLKFTKRLHFKILKCECPLKPSATGHKVAHHNKCD